jgi:hypothetical protein
MIVDPKCTELARYFLDCGGTGETKNEAFEAEVRELAAAIQHTVNRVAFFEGYNMPRRQLRKARRQFRGAL